MWGPVTDERFLLDVIDGRLTPEKQLSIYPTVELHISNLH